ncbi:hypothetical protein EV180_001803 [Coemansia sp. RSA 518]|nr:hypothetical protein IW145_001514 [Coemansia sp. RSA 521]KAJ2228816.1 hypothetical protein EV180_001803 [Coemansia sp. RSA 518]KAJ2281096.1 hypothetical protein GGH14_002110 [Coemansia sp. RSA 370]KAJ2408773.1 hypothetical protein J3F80_001832 [Coemansia sp. RSA 2526]
MSINVAPDTLNRHDTIASKSEHASSPDPETIEYAEPDTKYAWLVAIAALLNLATTMGTLNSFGVYQQYYLNTLYSTDSAVSISWISTLISFCMFVGGVFTGKLVDKFGFRITCFSGSVVCCIALILASFTSRVWQLVLTQGIMLGLGASLIFSPSISVVAQWHTKHRVLATGIAVAGGGIGGMVFSVATEKIIDNVSYKWSLRILGLLLFTISGASSMVYKRRIAPAQGSNTRLLFTIARDPRFICIALAVMFINMGYFEPLLYVPTLAVIQSGTQSTSSNIVLVFNAGTTIGRVLSGLISKLIGPANTNLASNFLCCLFVCIFMFGINTVVGYYIFSALFGTISTLYLAVNTHILAHEFGPQVVASSVGLSMACCGVGVLVGNPVQGVLYETYDKTHTKFNAVSAWAVACFAAATACYMVLRWLVGRKHKVSWFQKI